MLNAHESFFAQWVEFKLPDDFIEPFKTKVVPWGFGDLSYITFKRSYANALDPDNQNGPSEEWWQLCRRVIEGTISSYLTHDLVHEGLETMLPVPTEDLESVAKTMYERMFEMKWLPPGRGLYAMGTKALRTKGAGCLNNCMFVSTATDLVGAFYRLMDFSMLGVGVGFDTRGAGVQTGRAPFVDGSLAPYIVEDTRQGWCGLVHYILDSVRWGTNITSGYKFGKIRPKDSPLRTFGGTASGPEPLIALVTWLLTTFGCKVQRVGLNLLVAPREAGPEFVFDEALILDIGTQIGHCVVMGGIRRTALICLGKAGGILPTAKHDIGDKVWRHRSNNSILVDVGDDYSALAAETQKWGEPGYFWLNLAREFGRLRPEGKDWLDTEAIGSNPCMEQTLFENELCCLVELFPARHLDEVDFEVSLKCAYLYAKAVTLLPTHDLVVNEVIKNNRRVGVSMAGIVQAIEYMGEDRFFNMCDSSYRWLRAYDKTTSDVLGVATSRKLTSVKPGGTVPLLAGATPGMHYDHAPYYIRRERFSDGSPYLKLLAGAGYDLEPCADDPSAVAVNFLVHSTEKRHKPDVSAEEQMRLAARLQNVWADNQVSVTVHFRPEESVEGLLKQFDGQLKGVSFIPFFDDTAGDMPYKQLPYETINKDTYERLLARVTPLAPTTSLGHETTDAYCDSDRCVLPLTV